MAERDSACPAFPSFIELSLANEDKADHDGQQGSGTCKLKRSCGFAGRCCGAKRNERVDPFSFLLPESFIIAHAPGRISQHPVSGIDFRCRTRGCADVALAIRMTLLHQTEVSRPDLGSRRIFADAEKTVMIEPRQRLTAQYGCAGNRAFPGTFLARPAQCRRKPLSDGQTIAHPLADDFHLSLRSASAGRHLSTVPRSFQQR